MRKEEPADTPRPRWVAWLIVVVMATVMAGMLNIGWRLLGG